MPQLVVLRHAQAEPGEDDVARPLTAHGRAQAAALALTEVAGAVVSPAVRTRQTWELLELDVPVTFDARVYDATIGDLLAVVQEAPPGDLLLVGHDPGVSGLVRALGGDPLTHLPTAGIAVVERPS